MRSTLISLLLLPLFSTAQSKAPQTREENKIIFEDDFTGDSVNKFPKHWNAYPALMNQNLNENMNVGDSGCITVQEVQGEHVLEVHSHQSNIPLWPNLGTTTYLNDSFNVEFDAVIEKEKCDIALIFYDKEGKYILYVRLDGTGSVMSVQSINPEDTAFGTCPKKIRYDDWHHFAWKYRYPSLYLFIDGDRSYTIPDCSYPPANLAIGGNAYIRGTPFVRFANFLISTGDIGNNLDKLLTDKKFTTHAIHFPVNKSTIMPSCRGFIVEVAAWLKQNPTVKLEIDGHTDSDGDDKANLKLSYDRSNEVIAQLVRMGIAKKRLTAKGFGATKPLEPNTTPAAKANNRRVEFIKLPD